MQGVCTIAIALFAFFLLPGYPERQNPLSRWYLKPRDIGQYSAPVNRHFANLLHQSNMLSQKLPWPATDASAASPKLVSLSRDSSDRFRFGRYGLLRVGHHFHTFNYFWRSGILTIMCSCMGIWPKRSTCRVLQSMVKVVEESKWKG